MAVIAVWPIPFHINMLTALKGPQLYFIFFLLSLQLVLCRVAELKLKKSPAHHP